MPIYFGRAALTLVTAAAALLALSFAAPVYAQNDGRIVQCRIESEGKVAVSGRCRFVPDTGGSFSLENLDPTKPLFDQIVQVTVTVISPGVTEVRGLTNHGVNSRWGEARRSTQDRACWAGSDFAICAR